MTAPAPAPAGRPPLTIDTAWLFVAVTGHREHEFWKLPDGTISWIKQDLHRVACRLRDEYGMLVGISGMAYGVDLWWAEAVLAAGCRLAAYWPYPGQTDRWRKQEWIDDWTRLSAHADPHYSRTVCQQPSTRALFDRNEAMVDDADAVVTVWLPGKRSGGTWHCLNYARRQQRPGVYLNPVRRATTFGLPDPARFAA